MTLCPPKEVWHFLLARTFIIFNANKREATVWMCHTSLDTVQRIHFWQSKVSVIKYADLLLDLAYHISYHTNHISWLSTEPYLSHSHSHRLPPQAIMNNTLKNNSRFIQLNAMAFHFLFKLGFYTLCQHVAFLRMLPLT